MFDSALQVLNVMTGVFVNSAIKTRERDHETLMQNKQKFTDLVKKLLGATCWPVAAGVGGRATLTCSWRSKGQPDPP